MIRQYIYDALYQALTAKAQELQLSTDNGFMTLLNVERPKLADHGDYAVNVSPLARLAKMAPPQIATRVAEGLADSGLEPSVIGGFINFKVGEKQLLESLVRLVHSEKPGENQSYRHLRCLLEFVSANPTGPLHVGHGRWVALGDSLARILTHCGAMVTREFYINDAGSQMFNIANTLWYRCLELLNTGGKLPDADPDKPYPFYPAPYVIELAQAFIQTHREQVLAWDNPEHKAPDEAIEVMAAFVREKLLEQQKNLMETCRLYFDAWFSERTLHQEGQVLQTLEALKGKGVTYEQDNALWFSSSRFGDDQDRVLVKSDGKYTYLTADIAYHHNKYNRSEGYNCLMNIWGADHHGYIARMKAAMEALGHDASQLEIILGQLVNLIVEGERTRMGKRKKMLTLQDLVDEVGVDAVRFWMVSKSQDTALDFNVELAASSSDENPVFYVQYAHARCCSILRNAFQPRLDTLTKETLPPLLSEADWQQFLTEVSSESLSNLFSELENEQAQVALKELILKLDSFEDRVIDAARTRSPHIVARYTRTWQQISTLYTFCRVLVPQSEVAMRRLIVIYAIKRVLAQALDLLGVSAPEQM